MTRDTESHVSFRHLLDLHDGVLSGARSERARAHMASGCDDCVSLSDRIAWLLDALADAPLDGAPERDVRQAIALYHEVHGSVVWPPDDVLFGTLVLDQREELAVAVRAAAGDTRRLLWTLAAGDGGCAYEVDAVLVRRADGTDLLGQVLPATDDSGATLTGHVAEATTRCARCS